MEELKTKRAEEAAVAEANKPDPDCPKGHRKMSEEERRSTLSQLKQSTLTTFKEYILTPRYAYSYVNYVENYYLLFADRPERATSPAQLAAPCGDHCPTAPIPRAAGAQAHGVRGGD